MNNPCMQWRDQLLETALGQAMGRNLEAHLAQCRDCSNELDRLRTRREILDTKLAMIAGAEPSPDLRARILATAEVTDTHSRTMVGQQWAVAGAATVMVIAVMLGWILSQPTRVPDLELKRAQALAQWRAPTDVFLQLPVQQFLNTPPKLGDSYLTIPEARKGEKE